MPAMKHSVSWALIVIITLVLLGCGACDEERSATIVIAEGNSLLFQTRGSEPITYGEGDSLFVEWDGETCYVNGQIHRPQPPQPPTVHSLEKMRDRYGSVPFVLEYVQSQSGDETELWNEAYRLWEEETQLLTRGVVEQYRSDVQGGKTPDEAAEVAMSTLRASPLVASVRLFDKREPPEGSTSRLVLTRWAGMEYEEVLALDFCGPLDVPSPRPVSHEDFKSFVRMMRTLESRRLVKIELKFGDLVYSSAPRD